MFDQFILSNKKCAYIEPGVLARNNTRFNKYLRRNYSDKLKRMFSPVKATDMTDDNLGYIEPETKNGALVDLSQK